MLLDTRSSTTNTWCGDTVLLTLIGSFNIASNFYLLSAGSGIATKTYSPTSKLVATPIFSVPYGWCPRLHLSLCASPAENFSNQWYQRFYSAACSGLATKTYSPTSKLAATPIFPFLTVGVSHCTHLLVHHLQRISQILSNIADSIRLLGASL